MGDSYLATANSIWDWLSALNWSQFVPDLIVAAATGLFVAFALRHVDRRRKETDRSRDAAQHLDPSAQTLETTLFDGIRYEPGAEIGSASLKPLRSLRDELRRVAAMEMHLDRKARERCRQMFFVGWASNEIDRMAKEADRLEPMLFEAYRRMSNSSSAWVIGEVASFQDLVRDAGIEAEPDELDEFLASKTAKTIVDASGLRRTEDEADASSADTLEEVRSVLTQYVHARRFTHMAIRAHQEYCGTVREQKWTQSLQEVDSEATKAQRRDHVRHDRESLDRQFERSVERVQAYFHSHF